MAQIDYYRENAGNFIYIFLSDSDVKLFDSPIIEQKRLLQQEKVSQAAQWSTKSYKDFFDVIYQGIVDEYGDTPLNVILKLAAGENVYGRSGAKLGKAGIGKSVPINSATGFPSGLNDTNINKGYDLTTDGKYARIWNNNENRPIGVINQDTGNQISVYNKTTGKYESGVSTDAKDKSNFWTKASSAMPFIQSIIKWIVELFGGKTIKGYQMSASQSDGWYPPESKGQEKQQAGFSLTSLLPVAAIAVLAMQMGKDKDDEKGS